MRFLIALLILSGSNASCKMLWGGDLLTHYIHVAAKRHGVSATVLTAIAKVESRFGADKRVRLNSNGTFDVGPFQINSIHWDTTCSEYNVQHIKGNALCAAKLLAQAKRHKKKDVHWQGRYHSRTPSRKIAYYNKLLYNIKKLNKEKSNGAR